MQTVADGGSSKSQRDKPKARTIQQQLTRRHNCRYGLRGLACRQAGDDTPYRILESDWGKDCLRLRLVPAEQWDAYRAASDAELVRCGGKITELGTIISAAALDKWQEPKGYGVIETTADKVTLAEPWPRVCC